MMRDIFCTTYTKNYQDEVDGYVLDLWQKAFPKKFLSEDGQITNLVFTYDDYKRILFDSLRYLNIQNREKLLDDKYLQDDKYEAIHPKIESLIKKYYSDSEIIKSDYANNPPTLLDEYRKLIDELISTIEDELELSKESGLEDDPMFLAVENKFVMRKEI